MKANDFLLIGVVGWVSACATPSPTTPATATTPSSHPATNGQALGVVIQLYPADPNIQLRLAERYASGDGVPKDAWLASVWAESAAAGGHAPARAWLERRAALNDPFCEAALARLQPEQAGVAGKAVPLRAAAKVGLTRLADSGDHRAQVALAKLLLDTNEDATHVDTLLRRAAEGGYVRAQVELARRLREKEPAQASSWLEKAAAQKDASAELELGRFAQAKKDEAAAARWFVRAATRGLPEAERLAGIYYLQGSGVSEDLQQGREWLGRASEHGDAGASFVLSTLYAEGKRVPKDDVLSLAFCRKAAERGLAGAQVALGERYQRGSGVARDLSQARRWYEKAAAQRDGRGEFYLGLSYDGAGADEDPKRALELYERAAEHGSIAAETNIGVLYSGTKLKQDYALALKWYRRAAEHGDGAAQNNLGLQYQAGHGVPKDLKQAVDWFSKAAEHGSAEGMNSLGECYEEGKGVTRDLARAKEWYERAANAGSAAAQVNLGLFYETGTAVDKNQHTAIEWYKKAAAQGSARGALYLGAVLRFVDGPEHDSVEGCRQMLIGAKAGFARAQYGMGLCLETGDGVTADLSAAAYWFTEAAKQAYAAAEYHLALLYLDGRGVQQDRVAAEKWLGQAATHGDKVAAAELASVRERQVCSQSGKTELFGVKLGCASRRELRRALGRSAAKVTSEDENHWFDEYETASLLDESRGLELWYTRDNAWLARARYDFPSSLDTEQVVRIADMVAHKYGAPASRRGVIAVGEVAYEWLLPDGVRLSVWRGWPDTTTYLDYKNPKRLAQMEREMAADDRAGKQRRAASQAGAF